MYLFKLYVLIIIFLTSCAAYSQSAQVRPDTTIIEYYSSFEAPSHTIILMFDTIYVHSGFEKPDTITSPKMLAKMKHALEVFFYDKSEPAVIHKIYDEQAPSEFASVSVTYDKPGNSLVTDEIVFGEQKYILELNPKLTEFNKLIKELINRR